MIAGALNAVVVTVMEYVRMLLGANGGVYLQALLSIAAKRDAIAARSGQKQQNAMQCSNAERLEKAAEAGAIAGIKRARCGLKRVNAGAFHLKPF